MAVVGIWASPSPGRAGQVLEGNGMRIQLARTVLAAVLFGISALVPSTRLQAQQPPDELRLLAEQGDADAQFNLAVLYGSGQGVQQDWVEAARWLRLAADQGHAPGQSALGLVYREGLGVLPDFAEAVRWLRRGADQGDVSGQFLLASMYANGQGVLQDNVEAFMWLSLAAAQSSGENRATYERSRATVAGRMTAVQIAEAQRLAREWTEKHQK